MSAESNNGQTMESAHSFVEDYIESPLSLPRGGHTKFAMGPRSSRQSGTAHRNPRRDSRGHHANPHGRHRCLYPRCQKQAGDGKQCRVSASRAGGGLIPPAGTED
uniref:Uncharacterized protein n=1 Tax=Dulem virus 40 TaxID=3145758 RepID=A0AAU8AUR4_9CAUD